MIRTVYADLYFLINTGMNLLCLMITATLLHQRVRRWRAIVAAALGGVYALSSLLWGNGGIPVLLLDCAMGFIMCTITFWKNDMSVSRLLQCTGVQVLSSMLLGGIMTGLYSLLNRLDLPLDALSDDGISVWIFALLATLSALATVMGGRFFGLSRKSRHVEIELVLFGAPLRFSALVDSGNLLRDPVSGKSVIVVDRNKLIPILPPPLAKAAQGGSIEAWLKEARFVRFIRFIPTKTATGQTLLPAIVPEKLTVKEGRGSYSGDYLIAPGELGEHATGFDAIISAL